MKKAKILSSKVRLELQFLRVTWDEAIDPEGHKIARAVCRHPGSAVMMPVDDKGRVLLERQFRLPANDYVWELPAGRLDPGETTLQAAKRELREETGLSAKKWTKLTEFYSSPGFLDEKMTLYVAQDLREGARTGEDDERIELRWFSPRELKAWIAEGKIRDAKTITGLLLWFGASRTSRPKQPRGGSR